MRYAGKSFSKRELAQSYRKTSTKRFADANGLSLNQARRIAAINGWRKDEVTLCQLLSENASSRWTKRVHCAVDVSGLTHAVSTAVITQTPKGASLRMRCGARFAPQAVREKDFPACVKCVALIAAAREKPKMPPVDASGLKRKNRKDKCKNR